MNCKQPFEVILAQLPGTFHLNRLQTARPYIVAGDFNAFTGEKEIRLLQAASKLESANCRNLPSYPNWRLRRHLDFILHSPEIEVSLVQLSDHLPLIIDFEIKPHPPES